jgi:4-hydroxybenzoate polyprenyltransferase
MTKLHWPKLPTWLAMTVMSNVNGRPMFRGGEVKIKQILEFVKVEHTLFSLPFILIGYIIADSQFGSEPIDLMWILIAAVGARGLAMTLNRIIDRDIDSVNPRTENRHLASGAMSMATAWKLAGAFLVLLLGSAWMLNPVALMMAWLPVLAFVIYPYTKRFTWLCHFWLGLCLGLAPAGAWVAIAADTHGWAAITGMVSDTTQFLWYPEIFWISLGVLFWISAFDIQYARMDIESDSKQGIHSFPARYGSYATRKLSIALIIPWLICFYLADLHNFTDFRGLRYFLWIPAVIFMAAANLFVVTKGAVASEKSDSAMARFQQVQFKSSMLTGWVLLGSLLFNETMID